MKRDADPYSMRLMVVAVEKLPLHPESPHDDQLRWAADLERAATWHLGQMVALARSQRWSWWQIGQSIDRTAQSAHERFRNVELWTPEQMKIAIDDPIEERTQRSRLSKAERQIDDVLDPRRGRLR